MTQAALYLESMEPPRVAQRYANIITFSIPLLKGEVNIVDLLLIEGVKAFYPKLYNSIKEKSSYFLGTILDQGADFEQIKKLIIDLIDQSISDLSQESQICAKNLLKELFPRLTGILGTIHHGQDWQKTWTEEKRIASSRYFQRYFAYSIAEDDISDQSLIKFLNQLNTASVSNIILEIKKLTNEQNSSIDSFLAEMFRKLDKLSSSASHNLALALAQMGDYFPKPETLYSFDTVFTKAGILVSSLITRLDTSDEKLELCREVLQAAKPVSFATECFRWIRATQKDNQQEDKEDLFSESVRSHFFSSLP
ncbi:hypothetical protein VB713_03745 [Anabaena cylindrica UHCC 0172]|uniref:hypothetical protein n=1 Tax=Anabaena cylindrica TaxID=1165 RepID=UPI002B20A214|nr:hypothetical protein [Anabaena cylindrica]MEA5550101.1 hypothetical protein [Anabaena cylindrica UHCC 0172]